MTGLGRSDGSDGNDANDALSPSLFPAHPFD